MTKRKKKEFKVENIDVLGKYDLPCRLDRYIDDVGVGAMLKNLNDGMKAIVVDFVEQGMPVICMVSKKSMANIEKTGNLPSKPSDYVVDVIKKTNDWLVLTSGQDDVLID